MNLDDIVAERPLPEKPDDPVICPYCGGSTTRVLSKSSTLLGWSGPVNPNHQWHESVCNGCGKHFTREIKDLNVWYTGGRCRDSQASVLLKGRPSCFEDYQYTCAKCAGAVLRTHNDLQGNPAKALCTKWDGDRPIRQYTTHYNCTKCGHGGQVGE